MRCSCPESRPRRPHRSMDWRMTAPTIAVDSARPKATGLPAPRTGGDEGHRPQTGGATIGESRPGGWGARPRLLLGAVIALGWTCSTPVSGRAVPVPLPGPGLPGTVASAPAAPDADSGEHVFGVAPTSQTTRLAPGATGADVEALQRALRREGFPLRVDGVFGSTTRTAVRALQARLGLRRTGVADAQLLRRLGLGGNAAPVPRPAPTSARAIASAGAGLIRVFPVHGRHTYTNDFGAPRPQGSHEGHDILAARGTPLVAVTDGFVARLSRVERGLGGIWVWLRDRAGNTYYYAHMDSVANGLEPGGRVSAGQIIGTVGNSGDARYGATHLHFEIHPGGGAAINPDSELRTVDPTPHR